MRKTFYSRLAATNIARNRDVYLPYLFAGMLIVALYYILGSVSVMVGESGMEGGEHIREMLDVSANVCAFISIVVLFYINSFVMKRRKKEFGLYNILGMGKRHISLVILWEILLAAGVCVAGGILGGALLSQLLFLVLMRLTRLPVSIVFRIPLGPVLSTTAVFCTGFAVMLAANALSVWRSSPAALLRSASEGEREPKSSRLLTAAGIASLAGGYLVAWTTPTPFAAMNRFPPAVLLVILGTFLLFTTGSIALLKLLRRRKSFYYKPSNFVAVSGMLYRMKRNAAGLANICILASCVLVTLSSTLCLFLGEEDLLRAQYPRQIYADCRADVESAAQMKQAAAQNAARYGFETADMLDYHSFAAPFLMEDGALAMEAYYTVNTYSFKFVPVDDYNRLAGTEERLEPGEVLLAGTFPMEDGMLRFNGLRYTVRGAAQSVDLLNSGDPDRLVMVILPSLDDLFAVKAASDKAGFEKYYVRYEQWYNLSGEGQLQALYGSMRDDYAAIVPNLGQVDSIDSARNDFYQIYGSLLFVGIFFVALFLIATVLIIYYKQITEGFDDQKRFHIMEQVGMSGEEVRGAIRKQVQLVFFLPLGLAVIHIASAFRVLCMVLLVFGMDNTGLFLCCVLATTLLFAILYFAVYRLTARTYYRIVQAGA